jgi:hypothetical protein
MQHCTWSFQAIMLMLLMLQLLKGPSSQCLSTVLDSRCSCYVERRSLICLPVYLFAVRDMNDISIEVLYLANYLANYDDGCC